MNLAPILIRNASHTRSRIRVREFTMPKSVKFVWVGILSLVSFFLGIPNAKAGDFERQIILSCFSRGANNTGLMFQCSGMLVSTQDFNNCIHGGPCMDRPWPGAPPAPEPRQVPNNGAPVLSGSQAQQIAQDCAVHSGTDVDAFAACAEGAVVLPQKEQAVLDCAVSTTTAQGFAVCAAPKFGVTLTRTQQKVAGCAMKSSGDEDDFASCAGSAIVDDNLSDDQKAALECAKDADGDASDFAECAGENIVGKNLSKEQRIAVSCAAQSEGDGAQFASCAGANFFNLNLNPEQQIAVTCVVQTGGQPYAAAGCMATRLTARELEKCATDGIGGDGCFGDNNDLVGKNGWVARTMGQIAGGPNSVVRNPDQIWGGNNSFLRNPGQIWGGSNSFVRNPGQFWGGNNSVFHNPSQLAPPPVTLGTIAGHRVCVPRC